MKNQLLSVALLLAICITSCKKDSEDESPQTGNYAENEALIEDNSTVYFIADVEGLAGTTKVICQNGSSIDVNSTWGSFICDPGYDGFTSSCGLSNNLQYIYYVDFLFMGKCPDCKWEDVVKTGDLPLAASDKIFMGAAVWFMGPDQKLYYSDWYTHSSEQVNDEIKVISIEPNSDPFPSHYATVHFSCTLKSDDGKTIRLKNAVARVFTDDMIM